LKLRTNTWYTTAPFHQAGDAAGGRSGPAAIPPAWLEPVPQPDASAARAARSVTNRYAAAVPKLCPKIILEGTRLTGKTEIALALNEHPRVVGPRKYRYTSPLVSAEWCGFTNVPWGHGLVNFDPAEERQAMETYATWARLFELLPYYSWIVDRFHLSTQVFQRRAHGRRHDFRWLEERLQPLGFRIVLCTRRPETFERARAERLRVSGNPRQYDDLRPFVEEQEDFRAAVRASALPSLELDVSDGDVTAATGRIADWMEASGGLYAPWPTPTRPARP
jgi:hypothetical protein